MKIAIPFLALLLVVPLAADTVETVYLNAPLSPIKEVPSLAAMDADGSATVQLHLQRDDDGALISAFVTFIVQVRSAEPESLLAMHIHEGAAGENGPIRIPSGLEFGGDPVPAGPEPVRIWRQVSMTDAAGLARVEAVLGNPGGFYVNVHAGSQPAGLMRGQLRMLDVDRLAGMITNLQGSVDAIATQQTSNSTILRSVGLRLGVVRRGE